MGDAGCNLCLTRWGMKSRAHQLGSVGTGDTSTRRLCRLFSSWQLALGSRRCHPQAFASLSWMTVANSQSRSRWHRSTPDMPKGCRPAKLRQCVCSGRVSTLLPSGYVCSRCMLERMQLWLHQPCLPLSGAANFMVRACWLSALPPCCGVAATTCICCTLLCGLNQSPNRSGKASCACRWPHHERQSQPWWSQGGLGHQVQLQKR